MASESELVALQRTLYTSKNPTRRWLHCTRRDWIVEAIRKAADQGVRERALEIGPGSGVYLPALAGRYREVVASDIEEGYLKHASDLIQRYPNLRLRVDDITRTALPREHFDLILCTEVIEHIADVFSAIAGIHALLKKGGILILSTPQRYSPLEFTAKVAFLPGIVEIVRLIYGEPILETGHINLMTEQEVVLKLKKTGFRIGERFKSGMYLPFVAEFMGRPGLRLEQWLESKLRGRSLDWLLWTQYYIAEK